VIVLNNIEVHQLQVLGQRFVHMIVRGRLYSSCVLSSMLHGSETWPVRKENEVALLRADMRMVRWMCGVRLQDRVPSKGLRERLGLDDIISVLQQNRLQWYGHVLRKEDNDWVKNVWSMEGRVPGQEVDQRKPGERLWEKDSQACKLNREDAMDRNSWRKQIRDD